MGIVWIAYVDENPYGKKLWITDNTLIDHRKDQFPTFSSVCFSVIYTF